MNQQFADALNQFINGQTLIGMFDSQLDDTVGYSSSCLKFANGYALHYGGFSASSRDCLVQCITNPEGEVIASYEETN